MSLKLYGIYLAFPPKVNLQIEGLGRHLIEFLKSAQHRGDIRFCIALPSWSRNEFYQLLQETGIKAERFEFISPRHQPILLDIYDKCIALKKIRHKTYLKTFRNFLSKLRLEAINLCQQKIVTIRNPILIPPFFVLIFLLGLMVSLKFVSDQINHFFNYIKTKIAKFLNIEYLKKNLKESIKNPAKTAIISKFYSQMLKMELSLLNKLINKRNDIAAWYCPTAFWPQFNNILKPCLMCVPDVTPADFPIGFSLAGDELQLANFKELEKSIMSGKNFVTYSEHVKWQTLVARYHIAPDNINVIRNGTNELAELVCITNHEEIDDEATDLLCRPMISYDNMAGRFIFYASQFRPNKNIISLLRAYQYLQKKRLINHKLVLTGNLEIYPEIHRFVLENNLSNEVVCLHNLSAQQLAACYRLADLAVNPSLNEGGFPFTYSEALSVNTPVIMSRIPVTEELITCPELQELMLFDPYSWQDIAKYIELALKNPKLLFEKQKLFYNQSVKRPWKDVVSDYITILDRISSQ